MPVATIQTQTESYTIYAFSRGYQGISDQGSKTPVFASFERLQSFLSRQSRIAKVKTRIA